MLVSREMLAVQRLENHYDGTVFLFKGHLNIKKTEQLENHIVNKGKRTNIELHGECWTILNSLETLTTFCNSDEELRLGYYPFHLVQHLWNHPKLSCYGLEGRAESSKPIEERQSTTKYVQPLFNWAFQDVQCYNSFWCEKGNKILFKESNPSHSQKSLMNEKKFAGNRNYSFLGQCAVLG
ncbi:hypothetical protein G9A89_018364 [Geosiphon pyriformis]|nr:hypothetical protein G9A89_018364 [Geosiphon pyriformis]